MLTACGVGDKDDDAACRPLCSRGSSKRTRLLHAACAMRIKVRSLRGAA